MVTQEDIHTLLEDNKDSPGIAEAAYLAAKYLSAEQIDRNLRLRYGSGQGFAQFKDKLVEITVYDAVTSEYNSRGAQIELETEDESTRLDRINVEDVDIELDKVIRDAFVENMASRLGEDVNENLSVLGSDANIVAYIARRGYDLGVWETRNEPATNAIWNFYSISTGDTPTSPMKTDILEELVERGCFYVDNDDILLTPAFSHVEDPYDQLPQLELTHPET